MWRGGGAGREVSLRRAWEKPRLCLWILVLRWYVRQARVIAVVMEWAGCIGLLNRVFII